MPGITIKKIPDDLYQRLVDTARTHRRSLAKEIVVALERHVGRAAQGVAGKDPDREGTLPAHWPPMIVVDTNVLVYLLLPTPHAAQADAILLKDPDWIAPALIHSEFRNVLLGAVRRKDIEADDAPVLLDRALEVITVPEGGANSRAVLSLALASACSAYDCEFVWLARDLRVPRVTAYRQVLGAFPDTAVPADVFLDSKNE